MNSVKNLHKINMLASMPCPLRDMFEHYYLEMVATLDKGKHINNNKMDCQSYRKRRPAIKRGGAFAWQGKEENISRDGQK